MDYSDIIQSITPVLTLLLGSFLFYESKKRKAAAEAKKAEEENITAYAAEWKELYEKKEKRVEQLDNKIDDLYRQLDDYRSKIRDLKEERAKLQMENMKLNYHRCDVKGCTNRRPPSEVMN